MLIDMPMLLALFILALQMHTDMGDERGIRLRCISLGRAALRGSRMRGMAPVWQRLGISDCQILSLDRSFKCVRCSPVFAY